MKLLSVGRKCINLFYGLLDLRKGLAINALYGYLNMYTL
jgi:hypothetical protein